MQPRRGTRTRSATRSSTARRSSSSRCGTFARDDEDERRIVCVGQCLQKHVDVFLARESRDEKQQPTVGADAKAVTQALVATPRREAIHVDAGWDDIDANFDAAFAQAACNCRRRHDDCVNQVCERPGQLRGSKTGRLRFERQIVRVRFELGVVRVDDRHTVAPRIAQARPTGDKERMDVNSASRLIMLLTLRRPTSGNVRRYGVAEGNGSDGIRKTSALALSAARHARRKAVYLMSARAKALGQRVDRRHDAVNHRPIDLGEEAYAEAHAIHFAADRPRTPA